MNRLLIIFLISVPMIWTSCKPKAAEVTEEPPKDTVVVEQPVAVVIDSTKIYELLAQRNAASKGSNTTKAKKQDGKNVRFDSDPAISEEDDSNASGSASGGGNATGSQADAEGYYYAPGTWASFPGGEAALDKFLADNLKYPGPALEAGVQGTVYAQLFVDNMGHVVDIHYPAKKLGYGLEAEVTRVIKSMPQWNPGQYENAKVKSKFVLPVRFELH